jgi:O-antigen/teichoic acid export membrane protein
LLTIAFLLVAMFTFIRGVVVARGISVSDFGIASALLATLAFVEMSTTIAMDKLLLQDQDGGSDGLLASAHTMSVVRGFMVGVILCMAAWPMSYLLKLTDIWWAFLITALVPVITGFTHFDYVSMQRESNQLPAALLAGLPQLLITAITVPAVIALPDYRVSLVIAVSLPILIVGISHHLALRPYRLGFDKTLLIKMFRFAWPLMISGMLLFIVFQGDKLIVGAFYNVYSLGLYALLLTVFLMPSMILHRLYNAVVLPILSKNFHEERSFEYGCTCVVASLLLFSGANAVFFLIVGGWLFITVFGEAYEPALNILPWVVLMVSIRVLRIAPSLISLATANTKCELYANLARTAFLPLACIFGYLQLSLESIAIAGILAELFALIVAFMTLRLSFSVMQLLRKCILPSGVLVALSLIALLLNQSSSTSLGSSFLYIFCLCLCLILVVGLNFRYLVKNHLRIRSSV